jgi:hypothetical protein
VPKSKAIKIMVLNGDSERDDFAGEIANFLTGDGYDVKSPLLSFWWAAAVRRRAVLKLVQRPIPTTGLGL